MKIFLPSPGGPVAPPPPLRTPGRGGGVTTLPPRGGDPSLRISMHFTMLEPCFSWLATQISCRFLHLIQSSSGPFWARKHGFARFYKGFRHFCVSLVSPYGFAMLLLQGAGQRQGAGGWLEPSLLRPEGSPPGGGSRGPPPPTTPNGR